MTDSRGRGPSLWALLALVVLAVFLAHGRSLGGDFVFDDVRFIRDNPRLEDLSRPWEFFTDPSLADGTNAPDIYRPLRTLHFAVDRALFGLRPAAFHAVSLLLHAINAWLVLRLLRGLGAGWAGATGGALLFAVHPAQVEAVAWISSRADLLGGGFLLGALLCWMRSRGPDRWYALTCILGLLACFAREASVVLPALLVLVDVLRPGGEGWRELRLRWSRYVLPSLLVIAFGLVARALLEEARGLPLGHLLGWWGGSWGASLATAARAALYQVLFLLAPFRPSVDWYLSPSRTVLDPWAWGAAAVLLGLLVASFRLVRRGGSLRLVGGGALFAAAAAFLTSHVLFPVGIPTAERFLYLPVVGLAMASVPLGEALLRGAPRRGVTVGILALLSMAAVSAERCGDWRDEATLWDRGPDGTFSPRAERASLGVAFKRASDGLLEARAMAAAGKEAEAAVQRREIEEFLDGLEPRVAALAAFWQRTIDVPDSDPRNPMAARRLRLRSAVRLDRGNVEGALEDARAAVDLAPLHPAGQEVLAHALFRAGRRGEAGRAMERAVAGDPDRSLVDGEGAAAVLNGAAEDRLSRGLVGAALRALRTSARLVPDGARNGAVGRVPEIEAELARSREAVEAALRKDAADTDSRVAAVVFRGVVEGDLEGARQRFQSYFEGSPPGAPLRNLWGLATMEADDTEEGLRAALAYHRETTSLFPSDAGAAVAVARCLTALGRDADARLALESILRRSPPPDIEAEARGLLERLEAVRPVPDAPR